MVLTLLVGGLTVWVAGLVVVVGFGADLVVVGLVEVVLGEVFLDPLPLAVITGFFFCPVDLTVL